MQQKRSFRNYLAVMVSETTILQLQRLLFYYRSEEIQHCGFL